MDRASQAMDLVRKAAEYLYAEDPDLVEGGCADVSSVVTDFLKRRGFDARVVYGYAKKGKRGAPFMHAWIHVEGSNTDPTLWVQKKNLKVYEYREEPGVEVALACPDDLSYYVDELDRVIE